MTHSITRCPKCKTSFRVTNAQLASAKGAVRCGSCLHIFDARENFIRSQESAPQPAKPAPKTAQAKPAAKAPPKKTAQPQPAAKTSPESMPGPPKQQVLEETDDFLISDDMQEEDSRIAIDDPLGIDDLTPEFGGKHNISEPSSSLFDIKPKKPADDDDEESEENADESWAQALLEEESAPEPEPKPKQPARREPERDDLKDEIDKRFDGRQTGTFDAVPDDFDQDHEFETFLDEDSLSSSFEEDGPDYVAEAKYDLDELDDSELGQRLVTDRDTDQSLLDAFEPEPLELTYQPDNTKRWLIRSAWIAGNVVLLLALIVQVGYLKFDSWSRVDPYRQWYAKACPIFGCTLPTRFDHSKIRISLVVRSHPQSSSQLSADAILINTAQFEQPFPPLAVRFSDINDQFVAEHVFQPREYLKGELAGSAEMPVGQPVQLNLTLIDPGAEAVNYRAYIPENRQSSANR